MAARGGQILGVAAGSTINHMSNPISNVRGLGLCSGGLDSILAAHVLRNQGIDVEWITFETPFFSSEKARAAAEKYGIFLTVKKITAIYMDLLRDSATRFGKNMNPCMDCHALMFRLAGEEMRRRGFDFLFSGEVLGQRPMSQNASSLRYVEKRSGMEGLILRPLSARCLPETPVEADGRVDRQRLLGLSGRSRKPQMALAEQFHITGYPSPAGGCLLTDKGFSARLRDLIAHRSDCSEQELHLLRFGRHLRLNPETKLVVGRTQHDNERIARYVNPATDILLRVAGHAGPLCVIPGGGTPGGIARAAAICIGYSKAPTGVRVPVSVTTGEGESTLEAVGVPPGENRDILL